VPQAEQEAGRIGIVLDGAPHLPRARGEGGGERQKSEGAEACFHRHASNRGAARSVEETA
jgi:hypothetical protein